MDVYIDHLNLRTLFFLLCFSRRHGQKNFYLCFGSENRLSKLFTKTLTIDCLHLNRVDTLRYSEVLELKNEIFGAPTHSSPINFLYKWFLWRGFGQEIFWILTYCRRKSDTNFLLYTQYGRYHRRLTDSKYKIINYSPLFFCQRPKLSMGSQVDKFVSLFSRIRYGIWTVLKLIYLNVNFTCHKHNRFLFIVRPDQKIVANSDLRVIEELKPLTLYPSRYRLKTDGCSSHLYSLNPRESFSLVKFIIAQARIAPWRMGFLFLLIYLEHIKFSFFVMLLIARHNIRVMYYNFEGSSKVALLQYLLKDHPEVWSFSTSVSFGYYPERYADKFKNSNVFLVWGDDQIKNARESFDGSDLFLYGGYIGDGDLSSFASTSIERGSFEVGGRVVIFDNVSDFMGIIPEWCVFDFHSVVRSIAETYPRSSVHVKTKRTVFNEKHYKYFPGVLPSNLTFSSRPGDLSVCRDAHLVIGLCASSLALYISSYGIPVVLYDPIQSCRVERPPKNLIIAHSFSEFHSKTMKALSSTGPSIPDRENSINVFHDFESHLRFIDVLRCVGNADRSKQEIISCIKDSLRSDPRNELVASTEYFLRLVCYR